MIAAHSDSDTNLLVGLLALQTQLVSRPELVAAVGQWMHDRTQTLGEILVTRRALLAGDLAILKALRDRLLDRHGGDVDEALAALTCLRAVRAALEGVADATLHACLARISALAAHDTTSVVAEPPAAVSPTVAGPPAANAQAGNAPSATAPSAPLATPVSPAPAASAGQASSARFRKERLLLEGNLGSLYLARDMELARDVVVKQIHARYADDPEAQARFHREVKYASELEHTGIVPIYGAGCHSDGRRYYVMRYIKGEDLRAAIDRCHQLSRSERMHQVRLLVGRFVAVCRAIAYAHDRRVLHRDLKPENIRLSEDGETIVVDWGLAKSIDSSSTAGAAEATLVHREERECNPTKQFQAVGTPA
jgi:tRNA A-37 threonylcarbamoyl transferase component Bud32